MADKPKWTDNEIVEMLDDVLSWLKPNMQPLKDDKGKVIGYKDVNINNYFYGKYITEKWGISTQNLYKLIHSKPYFESDYEMIKEYEKWKLISLGLDKKTDASLTKFVLSARHGWADKQEIKNDNTHKIKDFDIRDLIKFKDD